MQIVRNILTKWTVRLPGPAGLGLLAFAAAMLIYGFMDLRRTSVQRLPEFTLQQVLNPQPGVTADSLKSRPALVNVWASWCVACRTEHEFLMELGKTAGLPLIGLNYQDNREDAQRWLSYFGDPYRFSVYDEDGTLGADWAGATVDLMVCETCHSVHGRGTGIESDHFLRNDNSNNQICTFCHAN